MKEISACKFKGFSNFKHFLDSLMTADNVGRFIILQSYFSNISVLDSLISLTKSQYIFKHMLLKNITSKFSYLIYLIFGLGYVNQLFLTDSSCLSFMLNNCSFFMNNSYLYFNNEKLNVFQDSALYITSSNKYIIIKNSLFFKLRNVNDGAVILFSFIFLKNHNSFRFFILKIQSH